MLKMKEYVRAESLEQAYELNQKKTNRILGGMLWMRMSNAQINTGIDLSGLNLNLIEEDDEFIKIGAMVTLRELELNQRLNELFDGIPAKCVRDIVGVQFRNLATVGGSVFGRFGFSDVLTGLMVLDSYVELYKGGIVPLSQFAGMKRDNDILVRILIKKEKISCAYLSHRNTKTDFPVLAVAVSKSENGIRAAVGATPSRAKLIIPENLTDECAYKIAGEVATQSNIRASKEYRSHLCGVLLSRAFREIREKED